MLQLAMCYGMEYMEWAWSQLVTCVCAVDVLMCGMMPACRQLGALLPAAVMRLGCLLNLLDSYFVCQGAECLLCCTFLCLHCR